jgi:hypothetical protein
MFSVYENMVQAAPTHEWSSVAYYWFALRAWTYGAVHRVGPLAEKMLLALGGVSRLEWKQDITAKALLLKAHLNVAEVPIEAGFPADKLQGQLDKLQNDLAMIS